MFHEDAFLINNDAEEILEVRLGRVYMAPFNPFNLIRAARKY